MRGESTAKAGKNGIFVLNFDFFTNFALPCYSYGPEWDNFYQQAGADGLTFLAGSSSQVTPDVIRSNPAVRYDPTRFAFIGGVHGDTAGFARAAAIAAGVSITGAGYLRERLIDSRPRQSVGAMRTG